MSVLIGSARIDENNKINGGRRGDQTGREVMQENYYNHKLGWLGFYCLDTRFSKALAQSMRDACNNNNLGYSQNDRMSCYEMWKKYGSIKAIAEPCSADCSSLVWLCLKEAGINTNIFNTASEPAVLRSTGMFSEISVNNKDACREGMILVTKSKGHTAIVTSTDIKTSDKVTNDNFLAKVSITDLNIRKGPGTDYAKTGNYCPVGVYTIVEVRQGKGSASGWGKLKSGAGWIALDYAKRV